MLLFHGQSIPRHNLPVLYNNVSSTEAAQSEAIYYCSFLNSIRLEYRKEHREKCFENWKARYKFWPLISVLAIIISRFLGHGTHKVLLFVSGSQTPSC